MEWREDGNVYYSRFRHFCRRTVQKLQLQRTLAINRGGGGKRDGGFYPPEELATLLERKCLKNALEGGLVTGPIDNTVSQSRSTHAFARRKRKRDRFSRDALQPIYRQVPEDQRSSIDHSSTASERHSRKSFFLFPPELTGGIVWFG